jgi:hypothetical protein
LKSIPLRKLPAILSRPAASMIPRLTLVDRSLETP